MGGEAELLLKLSCHGGHKDHYTKGISCHSLVIEDAHYALSRLLSLNNGTHAIPWEVGLFMECIRVVGEETTRCEQQERRPLFIRPYFRIVIHGGLISLLPRGTTTLVCRLLFRNCAIRAVLLIFIFGGGVVCCLPVVNNNVVKEGYGVRFWCIGGVSMCKVGKGSHKCDECATRPCVVECA